MILKGFFSLVARKSALVKGLSCLERVEQMIEEEVRVTDGMFGGEIDTGKCTRQWRVGTRYERREVVYTGISH